MRSNKRRDIVTVIFPSDRLGTFLHQLSSVKTFTSSKVFGPPATHTVLITGELGPRISVTLLLSTI